MPLKNYTTTVSADRSIQQIQDSLVAHGAIGILFEYDGEGRIERLLFKLKLSGNDVGFSLPCEWRKFQAVLKAQNVKRWDEEDHVYRVAWRNIRDWVLAQMALYETEIVEMPQVFLPFATDAKTGKTIYERIVSGNLLIGEGD